jgi:hypothetical protein
MNTINNPVRLRAKEYIIGGAKYNVVSIFSETAKETIEQKMLKYVSDRVSEEMQSTEKAVISRKNHYL